MTAQIQRIMKAESVTVILILQRKILTIEKGFNIYRRAKRIISFQFPPISVGETCEIQKQSEQGKKRQTLKRTQTDV
jgi:hypothetical protein